jgi:hypothetical protein
MKKHEDPNYIAKLEQAIAKKYGEETIQNPRGNWDESKEEDYEGQLKKLSEKEQMTEEQDEMVEIDGVLLSKKLFTRESTKRTCPVCTEYSFKIRDDVFMNKFDCCYKCYIQWIEGREDRWKTGWRPNK